MASYPMKDTNDITVIERAKRKELEGIPYGCFERSGIIWHEE